VNTLPHATVYVFLPNLLNVLVQTANKMGLQKKLPLFSEPLPSNEGMATLTKPLSSSKRRYIHTTDTQTDRRDLSITPFRWAQLP
jgi:hypothetical protein